MPTYKDLDRVSNQSSIIAYDIKAKLTDQSFALPPEYYEFERYADFEIGGHFGCFASITTQLITTGSFAVPLNIPWIWSLEALVFVDNGHGTTNTQTIVLKTGTVPPGVGYVSSVVEDISVTGTFSFSCDSEILYDIAESQPGPVYMHPPYTILNQYERSTVGGTATCSITLNGQTVTATSAIVSSQTTEYTFDAYVQAYSRGSLAGKEQAILSVNLINSVAIPNKSYLFARSADQFVESTNNIKAVTQGADDAFGEAVTTIAEITVSNTLDRKLKNKGWVNAYNESYPDNLTVEFPYRSDITFSGNYESETTFVKYEIDSVLTLVNVLTDSVSDNNILTGNFVNTLSDASLIANGDVEHTTRMPFRGWSYAGASLYHQKELLLGSGQDVIFFPNNSNFSAYRFVNVGVRLDSGGSSDFEIRGSDVNVPIFSVNIPTTGTFTTHKIDLCFAYDLHNPADDIVNQDNPYPRWNPLPGSAGNGRTQNQDLFGIGTVGQVNLIGGVDEATYTLYRDDNTAKCDFVAPNSHTDGSPHISFPEVFTSTVIEDPTIVVSSYYGRRYWSQDVQGKNDEEYDLLKIVTSPGGGITYQPQTISGFIDNINNLVGFYNDRQHLGWTGNASTPNDFSSNLRDGYLNEDGYMSWLMGFGMQYIAGTQKFGFDRDLSQETADYDIFAQTIFDEINGNYIPDYPDPFGIEEPGEEALCLFAYNCVRGAVHGLVQLQELGQTVFVTNPSSVNRGSAVSDVFGRYQTASPFTQERLSFLLQDTVTCGIATTGTDPIVAKRNRVSFYLPPAPTASTVKSADLSKWYQHLIAYVNSAIVSIIYTSTYDFSVFEYLALNITNAINVAVRWKLNTNTNVIVLAVEKDDGDCYRYLCDDLIGGNSTLSTTLGTGTTPALAINKTGLEIYFMRTTDSSGSVKRIILDDVGNVVEALSIVISGNVSNDGLAAYWYNDTCYLVYNHTTNGITVVKSDDMGLTFS